MKRWALGENRLPHHKGLQISEELLFVGPRAAVVHSFWGNKNHKEVPLHPPLDWLKLMSLITSGSGKDMEQSELSHVLCNANAYLK